MQASNRRKRYEGKNRKNPTETVAAHNMHEAVFLRFIRFDWNCADCVSVFTLCSNIACKPCISTKYAIHRHSYTKRNKKLPIHLHYVHYIGAQCSIKHFVILHSENHYFHRLVLCTIAQCSMLMQWCYEKPVHSIRVPCCYFCGS